MTILNKDKTTGQLEILQLSNKEEKSNLKDPLIEVNANVANAKSM